MKRILLVCSVLLAPTSAAWAEPLAALTATNQLIRFDSATPGTIASTTAISGLTAGDALVGIDVRPSNNTLYGFAIDAGPGGANAGVGRVYAINLATGQATLAATLSADPADVTAPTPYASASGSFFGVDFNPVADRLRVVSDTGQSLRINVASGLTQLDGPAAYAIGDANSGTPQQVFGSAYTNSVVGAATTTLYNLDGSISALVTQNPPNDGTLNTVALTSLPVFADTGFDISGRTGIGYAVLDGSTLGSINLATGVVTELGTVGTVGAITGLTVLAPEPSVAAMFVTMGVAAMQRLRRRR